jgi:hypothetical protein
LTFFADHIQKAARSMRFMPIVHLRQSIHALFHIKTMCELPECHGIGHAHDIDKAFEKFHG